MIVSAVFVVELAMVALDMGPETLLVAAVVSCVAASVWCVRSLSMTTANTEPRSSVVAEPARPAMDGRVRTLRSEIVFGRNPARDADRLHATLIELIDDQLRHSHGIDRLTDDDRAAAVLGPELSGFIQDPTAVATLSDVHRIDRIVTLIEQL